MSDDFLPAKNTMPDAPCNWDGYTTRPSLPGSALLAVLVLAVLLAGGAGCQSAYNFDYYKGTIGPPIEPMLEPPREKSKVSLPAYQIEPPDILQIEALKLVPKPPYRIEIFDVLQLQVTGTLLDQPIWGYYLVEAEGTINLGPAYGKLRVAGLTVDEAHDAIRRHLEEILVRPEVSVQLARTAATQPVTGQYLVSPDGTINLRQYGVVHVAGRTITQARVAIQEHLAAYFDAPEVSIDVIGYNSKVYYIITEGANLGDNIVRVPITGNETVLDAISQIGGLSQLSSTNIWIARPAPGHFEFDQILPIDYDGITRGGETATNYQLMPGDRLFIAEDGVIAFHQWIAKLTAPAERLLGISSLGTSTVRGMQTLGRGFQLRRGTVPIE